MELFTAKDSTEKEIFFRIGVPIKSKLSKPLQQKSIFNIMAYMAKNFNIELYFFTSQDIDLESQTVNAVLVEGNAHTERIIPLPKILYNPLGVFSDRIDPKIRPQLNQLCFFAHTGIGLSKHKVYEMLSANNQFDQFLIETHMLKNFEQFLSLFKSYNRDVIVKPVTGIQGKGVVRVTFTEEKYILQVGTEKIFFNTDEELKSFYEENFTQNKQILQPYIISRTKYGNPFDIRIHARRGAEGKFKVFPYPRIAACPNEIRSNLDAGGHTMPIQKFLKQEYNDDAPMLYNKLMNIGNTFPDYFQSFFKQRISIMGIDVGIQRCGDSYELKFFEIQPMVPGYSGVLIEAAFTDLEYLQYLGKCLANGTLKK